MFAQQLNKKGMERAKYNNAIDVAFLAFFCLKLEKSLTLGSFGLGCYVVVSRSKSLFLKKLKTSPDTAPHIFLSY